MVAGAEVKRDLEKAAEAAVQSRPEFVPETDIYETEEAIHLAMNLPGVEEKDIDLSLENDVLTVSAPQQEEAVEGMEQIYCGSKPGVYKRSFTILAAIDKSKIKAKAGDGVLRMSLPKEAKSKPQKIKVAAE